MHSRRALLQQIALAATAIALPRWAWTRSSGLPAQFHLGIASGEPTPDGIVLWTRLSPETPAAHQATHTVHWELAHDAQFRRIVQRGQALAAPEWGHSVHVEVRGLEPGRWYHYRFHCGDATSATGRTRTAPAADELPPRLRLAFASCQRWEHGHYAAWRHAAEQSLDLVLFLGDYIYEYASPRNTTDLARTHALRHASTLADYRDRYALHKSDPALQQAHAACPWLVTWDDHEVQNDYASTWGRGHTSDFAVQRAAGWQAFYENMPLRASALTGGPTWARLQLYRSTGWGRLARLHLLDARQYRDWQACRPDSASSAPGMRPADCPALADERRSFLGMEQEQWLDSALAADAKAAQDCRWSVVAQQTLMAPRAYPSGVTSTDSWDGYPAARSRALHSIARHAPRNTVVLGGDIHQNYVCRLHAPGDAPGAPQGPAIASEFCGTSISSRSGTTQEKVDALVRLNPHVLLARPDLRGYGLAEVTPQRWTTSLMTVDDPLRPNSPLSTLARFVVEDGTPGPQRDAG